MSLVSKQSAPPIPLILRLIYAVLKFPAQCLLELTSASVQSRWFGSDVFARYTTYYTWLTNQLGHFTIGAFLYFVASCLAFLFADNATATCPAKTGGTAFAWALAIGGLFWLIYAVKEVADVLGERPGGWRRFRIDLREAALDGWTDAFFVGFGILAAHGAAWIRSNATCGSAFTDNADYGWSVVILLGICYAIGRGKYFLPQRSRFDASDLPFYFRLTCFYNVLKGFLWQPGAELGTGFDPDGGIEAEIERVASGAKGSPHVCIFGPGGSGKTALAVGIACNLISGPRHVLYLAASDLTADEPKGEYLLLYRGRKKAGLLTLDEARWIVVDHVSPSMADHVISHAARLARRRHKPVFIFACDHEAEDRDSFVRRLSLAFDAPCLAVHLDGVLPRRGSRIVQADAAEREVPGIGIRSPTAA